ncbi:MAG TPA: DPP IV N-terminal domain-containing protein [Vicinamibacterales bacterium]|nr:DPP IV N-terminal domain-containing protein [Vicinamibacterales bacterium]
MKNLSALSVLSAALGLIALPSAAVAQVTAADYQRAQSLRQQYESAAVFVPDTPTWVGTTHRFYYRRSLANGFEFVMVDADTQRKQPAFDHLRLAEALSRASGQAYSGTRLPFSNFTFNDALSAIETNIDGARWTCTLADYVCRTPDVPAPGEIRRGITGPVRGDISAATPRPRMSPDGKWMAFIDNYNVAIRPFGGDKRTVLSTDGSEGNYYDGASLVWSPDSTKVAAYRIRPGYRRLIHYVASSPEDQLQPEHWASQYAKPGDQLDLEQPVLFDIRSQKQTTIESRLFPNPYDMSDLVWRKDGRSFTFEYNQRGHQVYRVIEVDAQTGAARAVISEEPKTFFYYNRSAATLQAGKRYRFDLADGKEVVWMSERDGWNHLYLIDAATGAVKTQITRGAWPVRHVVKVDEEKRQLWFSAGGMNAGKDPYFQHYYRINLDGTGLTPLTTVDANHTVEFSTDMQLFVDHYSRVDMAGVAELHRADGTLVAEIEKGDITALVKAGWKAPEVFVAKGRDGMTDIWGLVWKPTRFDPSKKYPVIEYIYAGPHGTHTPKSFSASSGMQAQAELGFIVVQMDGMGTSNRSKAFHDVAWQNIKDAGFPDRILWHQALAAKNSWYDITRVGIYGGSAGGQNSMGALLFHPEFYKVAVSYAGCHDNRMDKIWWNEQWMGWPIGAQYSASSNVDNAHLLQGKLLLMVGELDTNVDPSSTLQVVNALVKANKNFDFLIYPGEDHNAGRGGQYADYGERKRFDFFVRHLLGQTPPEWSAPVPTTSSATRSRQ